MGDGHVGVFLFRRRHAHHVARVAVAAQVGRQQTLQPQAVAAGLEAADDARGAAAPGRAADAQRQEEREQGGRVAADAVQLRPLAAGQPCGDEPGRSAQLNRNVDVLVEAVALHGHVWTLCDGQGTSLSPRRPPS
jgi:hypothetical protein